jgi:hypothetical protein
MNDPLETLQAELARQNETLSAFEQTLRALGDDVELAIPRTFLDELEELTESRVININNPMMPFFGIRG